MIGSIEVFTSEIAKGIPIGGKITEKSPPLIIIPIPIGVPTTLSIFGSSF